MMSRVNKMIVGTATILADVGLKALEVDFDSSRVSPALFMPLYVCASIAKLTPRYCTSNNLDIFNTQEHFFLR